MTLFKHLRIMWRLLNGSNRIIDKFLLFPHFRRRAELPRAWQLLGRASADSWKVSVCLQDFVVSLRSLILPVAVFDVFQWAAFVIKHTPNTKISFLIFVRRSSLIYVFRRSCIRRSGNCDHRPNGCCHNSSCRCNLWGSNCRCQRMGLFQKWGK